MTHDNTSLHLIRRPNGLSADDDWEVRTAPVPAMKGGEFLVHNKLISIDPMMRGWLDDKDSYMPPVGLGEVMRAVTVGEVVESANQQYPAGTLVQGVLGAQTFAVSSGRTVTRIDPRLGTPEMWLGVLGNTGMTAYFGYFVYGQPRPGDCVLVSAASGAVGSIVGQLARISGCRVIGLAGTDEKCRYLVDELRLDAAIDYKRDDLSAAIRDHTPKGLDIYFDNVGGEVLEAALDNIALGARVVLCGGIGEYNRPPGARGPRNYMNLLWRRSSLAGFAVFQHEREYAEARRRLAGWVADGQIVAPDTVVRGSLENFNQVFLRLFSGDKIGKLILRLE